VVSWKGRKNRLDSKKNVSLTEELPFLQLKEKRDNKSKGHLRGNKSPNSNKQQQPLDGEEKDWGHKTMGEKPRVFTEKKTIKSRSEPESRRQTATWVGGRSKNREKKGEKEKHSKKSTISSKAHSFSEKG